jgi:hypothetical protein
MNEQITLHVPDYILQQAAQMAAQTNLKVENFLAEVLVSALGERPVTALADAEVLALTESRLPQEQEERLTDLLADHGEGLLDPNQQKELDRLMNVYERALLRQSQALREAVARGLIKPLSHEQN